MIHIVTVEFRVSAEPAPEQEDEVAAVEAVHAALATVANLSDQDALLSHLSDYVVRRVD